MMKTERTRIRRKNREIKDEQWVKNYLHIETHGVFASCVDDQAFINWNLFIYEEEENAIYFHTAGNGRTKINIQKNPKLCFSIGKIGDIVFAKKASDFSAQYKSVVLFGKAEIVVDENKLMSIFNKYFIKYAGNLKNGVDFVPFCLDDAKKATLFKLNIEEWSAKMNDDKSYQDNH